MTKIPYNINIDVAEGIQNEEALFPYLYACNIACGAHSGNLDEMKRVIYLAEKYNVHIGAHPSFPDRNHFGRRLIVMDENALYDTIANQIEKLNNLLQKPLYHVKAHGALYHSTAHLKDHAEILLNVLCTEFPYVKLFAPPYSELEKQALLRGIEVCREAFLDRRYLTRNELVDRSENEALLNNIQSVCDQFIQLTQHQKVFTLQDQWVSLNADTFCLHGDHPMVLDFLEAIYKITN